MQKIIKTFKFILITGILLQTLSLFISPAQAQCSDGSCCPAGWHTECTIARCTTWINCTTGAHFCYDPGPCGCSACPLGTPPPAVPPPGCSPAQPSLPVLQISPVNNSTITDNITQLRWRDQGDWGNSCIPGSNRFITYISPGCTGVYGNYTAGSLIQYGGQQYGIYTRELNWNTDYCWYINKCNPQRCRSSAVWRFRTPAVVYATESGIISADTCGFGYIGQFGEPNVHNPITYRVNFTDPNSNLTFREIWVGIIPDTGPFAERGDVPDDTILNQKIANARTGAVRINLDNGQVSMLGNGGAWTGNASSGSLSNAWNSLTVTNIGGSTTYSRVGNTASANFQLRFENTFPSGKMNVYVLAVMEDAMGNRFTSYATATDSTVYKFKGSINIDLNKPGVVVTNPPTVVGAGNDYRITLQMTDNNTGDSGVSSFYSSIHATRPGHQMRTLLFQNKTINPVPTSEPAIPNDINFTLASPLSAYNRSLRYFNDTPAIGGDFFFSYYAKDAACNVTKAVSSVVAPSPWVMSDVSIISALGGFVGVSIPNISFSVPLGYYSGQANLSADSLISGNNSVPSSQRSAKNQFAQNYSDSAVTPPIDANSANWFDHLLDRVEKNKGTPTSVVATVLSGPIVAASGPNKLIGLTDRYNSWLVNGNLTINSGSICNAQGIIFVNGNLIINPDFTNSSTKNACLFVVSGDMTVNAGTQKTAQPLASAIPSDYDVLEGVFIVAGTVNAAADNLPGNLNKWDGLTIKGGVYSQNLNFARNVNGSANSSQPSLIFIYDPRYKLLLAQALASRNYSVREVLN